MTQRLIHLPSMLSERPKDARKTIFSLLENQDCRPCGKCCQDEDEFVLVVLKKEPTLQRFIMDVKGAVLHQNIGSLRATFPDSCSFQRQDDNSCSIYDERPLVCQAFPFVMTDNKITDGPVVTLSSRCPDIARLRQDRVDFLYMNDIYRPFSEAVREMKAIQFQPRQRLAASQMSQALKTSTSASHSCAPR